MSNIDAIKICKDILSEYKDIVFAYIFGSYVQGTLRPNSDIDIAIYLEEKIEAKTYLIT